MDPAWPLVQEWSREATNAHVLEPAADEDGVATLAFLEGVTEWSVLGSLARRCRALVVQDWLAVLGAGGAGAPGLREANTRERIPGALVVAIDVVGGGFAVNGGGLPSGEPGEVCYLAPDDLGWLATGLGHAAFVGWALSGDVDGFYADLRWPAWADEVRGLLPERGVSTHPPVFTAECRSPRASRRPVPLLEAWAAVRSAAGQRGGAQG